MKDPSRGLTGRPLAEERLENLPMLPSAVLELIRLDPASDEFPNRVGDLARSEPTLAARILALANSASHAPVEPILSLPAAIARLGALQVSRLVTALAVMRVFVVANEPQRNLWVHSIQTAVAARRIAEQGRREVDPGQAYLLGLLHDVGRFVMLDHEPEDLAAVERSGWSTPVSLIQAERQLCGYDHCDLGWRASRQWGFPEVMSQAIRYHHHPTLEGTGLQPEVQRLLRTVQQADGLSCLLMNDPLLPSLDTRALEDELEVGTIHPAWRHVPLGARDLAPLVGGIVRESDGLIAGLGLRPA